MKQIILIVAAIFMAVSAYAQFPNTSNKLRLGIQTTGDGLIYRHAGTPSWTPTGINNAWQSIDTLTGDLYTYRGGTWYLEVKGDLQQVYPLVINKSGSPILRGQVVSVDTSQIVQGDQIRIMPAIGDGGLASDLIMGVAANDIADNASGYVAWFGYVREVDQSDIAQTGITLNVGDILYLSATEPGRLTNVEPTPPALKTTIALVVRKPTANNMTLLVRPKLNEDLRDLNDVDLNGINNGQTIVWDSINTKWIAGDVGSAIDTTTIATKFYVDSKVDSTRLTQDSILVYYTGGVEVGRDTIAGVGGGGTAGVTSITAGVGLTGGTITSTGTIAADTAGVLVTKTFLTNQGYTTNTGTVTGSGTTNTVAKFTGTTAIGNSLITDDGTNVAVSGTASLRVPSGTTAERPGTPLVGMMRNNTTNNNLDFYTGTAWENPLKSATATGLGTAGRFLFADGNGRAASLFSRVDSATRFVGIFTTAASNTGLNNVFIGLNAGAVNTTGYNNYFFGFRAGTANTTGFNNVFFGEDAGLVNTTGGQNIFMGRSAGFLNTTGGANNFFGATAGYRNTTGNNNNCYGPAAGFGNTTGSDNNYFGNRAGGENINTGSNNIMIGNRAGSNLTGAGSQNVVIGRQINLPVADGSSQLVISNLIFGTGATTDGTTIPTAGRVGIKNNTPQRDFHVAGEVRITDLITDAPTRIVGADADGDLGQIRIGNGLAIAGDSLNVTASGATNLTFSGASSPVTLNSDTGTDVTFTAGTNVTFSQSANNLTINATASAAATQIASLAVSAGQVVLSQFNIEKADNDVAGSLTTYATSDFVADSSYIRYAGTDTIYAKISGSLSFLSNAVSNLIIGVSTTDGGYPITGTASYFRTATSGQATIPVMPIVLQLLPNTRIYLNIENTTNNTITLDTFYNLMVEKIN
jgi:hypothetical protein